MRRNAGIFMAAGITLGVLIPESVSVAQTTTLPRASRTVYKCLSDGKVTYSDEPCPGAGKIDIEPTRGLNKSTGRELTGKDVFNERRSEMIAEAAKPITGMTPKQFEAAKNRIYLAPEVKAECQSLDQSISESEKDEKLVHGKDKVKVQSALLAFRKRYRDLKC